MAVVGYLGETANSGIVFEVSAGVVETLDNMGWSGSARYAVHQRHGTYALTEFVGLDPDKVTFDMTLAASLGTEPMAELKKLWRFERNGTALQLVIGSHAYGFYRWNITGHKAKVQYFDKNGDLYCVTVSVTLQEYRKG